MVSIEFCSLAPGCSSADWFISPFMLLQFDEHVACFDLDHETAAPAVRLAFCAHYRQTGNGHSMASGGFRLYRKSRQPRPGRPEVSREVRDLIRKMSLANPLWGAPCIHGKLLMLEIEVSQVAVAKYRERPRR